MNLEKKVVFLAVSDMGEYYEWLYERKNEMPNQIEVEGGIVVPIGQRAVVEQLVAEYELWLDNIKAAAR